MKHAIPYVLIAIVLFVLAGVARRQSQALQARADTHERLATLRFDGADDPVARYWRSDFTQLTSVAPAGAPDTRAESLLLRANAAFRAAAQSARGREEQIKELDAVLQHYVTALKAPDFVADAAYNYEYVVRLRDALSRPRAPVLAPPPAASAGDLPAGVTIHGTPGGPPPASKGEEFQIITPMEYGDRETQPEPNPGGKPLRKG